MEFFGLPQAITGKELVTIHQLQDGNWAKCTVSLSQLFIFFNAWMTSLPSDAPIAPGVLWNNNGVVSIS